MLKKLKYFAFYCSLLLSCPLRAQVNIAVWAPQTGSKAVAGSEILTGAQAAVNELNTEGGLLGKRISLIPIEDECQDSLAVSAAEMMALNKETDYALSAVIGPYCPNQFQRVTDTLAQAGIFQIIPTTVNAAEADNSHKGLVKMLGYKEQQAKDFFAYYNMAFNWMRVALIFDTANSEIAQTVQDVFNQNQQAEKLSIYEFENFDFDFGKIASQALEDGTQLAFILGNAETVSKMAKALKSHKRKYIIFANRHQVFPEFEEIMGSLANNCYFLGLPSLKDSPEFTETLVKLRLLGMEPEGFAVYGYSAVRLWADVVKKARSFQYARLAQVLKDTTFHSGWGRLMFTNGAPSNTLNYSIYLYHGGEYTQVY